PPAGSGVRGISRSSSPFDMTRWPCLLLATALLPATAGVRPAGAVVVGGGGSAATGCIPGIDAPANSPPAPATPATPDALNAPRATPTAHGTPAASSTSPCASTPP